MTREIGILPFVVAMAIGCGARTDPWSFGGEPDAAIEVMPPKPEDPPPGVGGVRVRVFTHTGATQTFVVPAGVTSLQVKLWAGAGGSTGELAHGPLGGAGAFVTHPAIDVTPGESLTILVGGGGGIAPVLSKGGFGGGGNGSSHPIYPWTGGGGGRSAIRRGEVEVITAGGGGGGGYYDEQSNGGAGCALPDGSGGDATREGAGHGGTLVAGGEGGIGSLMGESGSKFQGGNGIGGTAGGTGGGGGGLFGGGAGGHTWGSVAGGGGGGSCLVPKGGAWTSSGPPDPDWDGPAGTPVPRNDGIGGDGHHGRIVLRW